MTIYFRTFRNRTDAVPSEFVETSYDDARLAWLRVFSFVPNWGTIRVSQPDGCRYVVVDHHRI